MTTDIRQVEEALKAPLSSHQSSYEDLLNPPPTRKRGLRGEYWGLAWVGAFVLWLWSSSCVIWLDLFPVEIRDLTILDIDVSSLILTLPILLIGLGIVYTSPNIKNQRKMRFRYPHILRKAKKIPNYQQGEFKDYQLIPLNVNGRRVFLVGCGMKGQKYLVRGALLDEKAEVIDNEELFWRAHTTLNFAAAIVIKHDNTYQMKKQVNTELRKIPGFRKVLEKNFSRFEHLELSESARRALEGFERVEWAYKERIRFLDALYDYAGAAGYWNADDYFYEDAQRFRELDVAFAGQLREVYLPDISLRATVAGALIEAVKANPRGWRNRGKLIQALEFLIGANLVLEHWIKMSTTEVDEQMARLQKGYREKLEDLRSRGFRIVSE